MVYSTLFHPVLIVSNIDIQIISTNLRNFNDFIVDINKNSNSIVSEIFSSSRSS